VLKLQDKEEIKLKIQLYSRSMMENKEKEINDQNKVV